MRLIDADEQLLLYEGEDENLRVSLRVIKQNIKDAPTIEAEPIVHCKDCKHWHDPDENKWGDCYEWGGYSQENDYCSWGERKDEVGK